jgi:hypothetical protein
MKMAVSWVVAPCSLVEVYQRFRGLAASIIRAMIALMMDQKTASHLHTHRRENLKSYLST